MANYADYAKKQDQLEAEIDESAQGAQDRKDNLASEIPERFAGKSPEEISKSYVELERKFSQQGNDLGALRKTVDEFIQLKSNADKQEEDLEKQETPTTLDDIYADPDTAIRKVIESEAGERIAKLEEQLAQQKVAEDVGRLDVEFPGWRAESQKPEFAEWVQKDPIRLQTALMASQQNNAAAARSVISTWYEVQSATKAREQLTRDSKLRDATLESGGGTHSGGGERTFSRRELMDTRVAAKRGDGKAEKFLSDNREAIVIAYEQGRISD